MNIDKLKEIYEKYKYEVNGALVGFVFAIIVLVLNPLRALVILFFTALGFFIGKVFQKDKDYIKEILDRILPPRGFR